MTNPLLEKEVEAFAQKLENMVYSTHEQEFLTGYFTQALTRMYEAGRAKEKESVREWVNKNYRRSTEPLYAWVDAKECIDFLKDPNQTQP